MKPNVYWTPLHVRETFLREHLRILMSMFVDRGAHRISALLSFYSQDELEEAGARAAELEREPELGFTSVFTRPIGFNINAQVALVSLNLGVFHRLPPPHFPLTRSSFGLLGCRHSNQPRRIVSVALREDHCGEAQHAPQTTKGKLTLRLVALCATPIALWRSQ